MSNRSWRGSRSQKRQREIHDYPDVVAVPSAAIEIDIGVAQPNPNSAQGSFLNAVIERNIPLVLIGNPGFCRWIHSVGATGKVEGRAQALYEILKIVRKP